MSQGMQTADSIGDRLEALSKKGHWEKFCRLTGILPGLVRLAGERLMICYQQQNRRAEALAAYTRCQQSLRIQLGVEPSEATEKLRTDILNG